ncbi:MAG TPA: succinic semialdehyde dehydrogenase [Jatrophihabitantaceae bacterium]|jgi:succinate-semialdehyde dehydrogenase/glutarate-semialdehyde dehydrogenase|nr:succinic semialdehyde dehydrogenase [Jatrophihabitantaceae bacterium]
MTATASDLRTPSDEPAAALPPRIHRAELDRLVLSVPCTSGDTVTTHAPYTGAVIAQLPQCSEADVAAAFERARLAQRSWAKRPVRERTAIFLKLHDLILARQDEIMDLIQLENGKARRDAFLEVADVANTARYYARTAKGLLRAKRRTGLFPVLTSTRELRQPKGVVSIISPWNYPLALAIGDTIPALIAGNAVVQKPDNQTALTALWSLALAREAGLPADLWQLVLGRGSTIGSVLMDQAGYVMFTGSTPSGKRIAEQAGARLIGCSLELGGKNAMIVLDDAPLDRTVEGAVRACFSSSGQLCISIERMYVQDGIYDAFVPRFVEAVKSMRIGAGYDMSFDMGSLTSADQLSTVAAHVDNAIDSGATILAGGKARPDIGPLFFEPTVLSGVTDAATCFGNETFGPLVSIYRFNDVDQAVDRANDTAYGLNASVWTKSARRGRDIAARLRSGTVNINEGYGAAWGSVDAPMGGMGDSGLGRRHGADGLLKYTEAQTLARQRLMNIAPPGRMSQDGFASMMTRSLQLMRRIGWR